MRWENLSAPPDEGIPDGPAPAAPPLPLALPGAVARTFDTPGFAGMTFYEVRAKSILNRVPGTSRVPFQWTVNPYRGCSHACVYCLSGDTPILMADGRTKPIEAVRPGDRIYGTRRRGTYRRYVVTTVLDAWSTVKPAYRVTLADGTSLVAGGDHRFLTERGWKYVAAGPPGNARRPRLTTSNRLLGTGRFAAPPKQSPGYRRGYLCAVLGAAGVVDTGDGAGRVRLTLGDDEAADRSARFLAGEGVRARPAGGPTAPGRSTAATVTVAGQPDVAAVT
ncbi:radical SAM protein, partial [Micromonospora fluostatini]